jgi:hypothetical protein
MMNIYRHSNFMDINFNATMYIRNAGADAQQVEHFPALLGPIEALATNSLREAENIRSSKKLSSQGKNEELHELQAGALQELEKLQGRDFRNRLAELKNSLQLSKFSGTGNAVLDFAHATEMRKELKLMKPQELEAMYLKACHEGDRPLLVAVVEDTFLTNQINPLLPQHVQETGKRIRLER